MTDALVIGAGPAGLMAAETLAKDGMSVLIADAMPSAGRKFLMAGKSGLNLTKAEPLDEFLAAYGPLSDAMRQALTDFGPAQVQEWATGLDQEIFTGTSGRVFPKMMKASPLLRAWMGRLGDSNVRLETRWRWTGWEGGAATFKTPDGVQTVTPKVTILALGGASWARLGSDGQWAGHISGTTPFAPANMGFVVNWSEHMARHYGKPIKGVGFCVNGSTKRGEFVISERGIEGGGVYTVSRAMREGAALTLDLLPDWTSEKIRTALSKPRGKASLSNHLRKTLKLDQAKIALLAGWGRPFPDDLATLIKSLPVQHAGPRPIDEAISTAGGVSFDVLTDGFMLKDRPGVFCAGEMLDWEAPTGGYLVNACLASGRHAGLAALKHING